MAVRLSVVVATYRRPHKLEACLAGLCAQGVPPDEVVVVRRRDDDETADATAASRLDVRAVVVDEPGVLAALEAGSRTSAGEIVAFTDDDAVPRPDWIERLLSHLNDPTVGAVGGRDVLHPDSQARTLTEDVGRVTRWGKLIGEHHRGAGPARNVDVLKGVNMAFRRESLAFPVGLRGEGAQVNFELAMCLWARKRGWRLVYDPAIIVDHYPGDRFDADRRGRPKLVAVHDAAFNYVAAVLAVEPQLFLRRAAYGVCVGDRGTPGLLRAGVATVRGERETSRRLGASLAGQLAALRDHARDQRLRFVQVAPSPSVSRRPRRVVFTVPWGERLGGAENMLFSFLRRVDRSRLEPIVVFFAPGAFPAEVSSLGIRTHVLEVGRMRQAWKLAVGVRRLARLLAAEHPDLIVNWIAKAQLYGASAALCVRLSDRVVWWQHLIPAKHWMDRAATALPTKSVGCSSHASAEAQRLLRPRRATFVVHPGVEQQRPAAIADLARLRRALGIADGVAVVGIAGRLQPWKGQDRVLVALELLRRRGYRVHGLVVGGDAHQLSPEYTEHVRRLAETRPLRGHVTITGHVADVARYLQLMDVFVSASDGEPFGIALVEAMALGVPVVAVDAGGPREIIEHEVSGVLVPSGASNDLAEGVERLLVDKELRERVRRLGRVRSEGEFSAERMAGRMHEALESLAAW